MRVLILLLGAFAIAAAVHPAPAASLQLDENFQPPLFSVSYPASRALLLPDDKYLLYRFTETLNGERTGPITRHLADGSHDATFAFSRDYKDVSAAAVTPEGNIMSRPCGTSMAGGTKKSFCGCTAMARSTRRFRRFGSDPALPPFGR